MVFIIDLLSVVSIVLLIRRKSEVFPGVFAFFIGLIKISLRDRIDEIISSHLTIGNTKRQYLALVRIFLVNFFLAHLISSLFLSLVLLYPDNNWMIKYGINNNGWFDQYVYSVFWGVTILTTVGFGDITVANNAEAIVVTFVMIFGCLIFMSWSLHW